MVICFTALWAQAVNWYGAYLQEQELARTKQGIVEQASELSTLVHQRFALLQGLASFVETDIVEQLAIPAVSKQRLDTFLAGLQASTVGVRNFSVAPKGIIRCISPLEGNEKALGLDLFSDPRPSGSAISQRAVEQGKMVLTIPFELIQGGIGIAARQAVFSGQGTWGLVSMVLDLMPVLQEVGLLDLPILDHVALRDSQGKVFFGEQSNFEQNKTTQRVNLPDGYWELVINPRHFSQNEDQQLIIFKISLAAFLLLLLGFFMALQPKALHSHKILSLGGSSRSEESLPLGTPPKWLPPALTAGAIILVIFTFYFFLQRNDLGVQRQNLNQTIELLNSKVDQRLSANTDYLVLISEQISRQQLSPDQFQERVSRYVADHPSLINVTWSNSDFMIRYAAPYESSKQIIGLSLTLPEPKRASRLAQITHQAVYTKPFVVIQGAAAFEVYQPIYHNQMFLGNLGGVYDISTLLDGLISDALRSLYQVELIDRSGEVLFSDSQDRSLTQLSQTLPIQSLQQEIFLKVSVYKQGLSQSMKLLLMLSSVLAFGVAFSLWLQYKESCKHWQTGESLRASQQNFRAIADSSPMAIVICENWTGNILYANAQANLLFEPAHQSLLEQRMLDCYSSTESYHSLAKLMALHGIIENFELQLKRGDESVFWGAISAKEVPYDQGVAIITSISDLSERKRHEDQLFKQANFDALTGLPNRSLAFSRLERALLEVGSEGANVALMMLDLDHFKNVNDNFGHDTGDYLLKEIGSRLTTIVGNGATVARLGGDEFIVIVPRIYGASEAEVIAEKIIVACTSPLLIDGHEIQVSASVGIAMFPNDGANNKVLMKNADTAMYQCKAQGRNHYRFYTDLMSQQAQRQLQMEMALRQALANGEFSIAYQPLITTESNLVVGVEALLRWHNPNLGQIAPVDFIPLAESIGIINEIGQWVLETACQQIKQWRQVQGMPTYVAVNVSGKQLRNGKLVQVVSDVLAKFELPAEALELEITESVLLENTADNSKTLTQIHQMGVSLAIDDFGTGYSSLSYLRRFPFDTLKIDGSFIKDVPNELEATQLVSAIISMANTLGLNIVAEGVENKQQLDFITARHCQIVQGYFLAKPMAAAKLPNFVEQFTATKNSQTL